MAGANPVIDDVLRTAALRMQAAPHGGRRAIALDAAERAGLSIATVYRRMAALMPRASTVAAGGEIRAGRKQRSDAGSSALTVDEARVISTYLSFGGATMASFRTLMMIVENGSNLVLARSPAYDALRELAATAHRTGAKLTDC